MDFEDVMANIGIGIILIGLIALWYDVITGWRVLAYLVASFGPWKGFALWYTPLWLGALIKVSAESEDVLEPVDPVWSRAENLLDRQRNGDNPLERNRDGSPLE